MATNMMAIQQQTAGIRIYRLIEEPRITRTCKYPFAEMGVMDAFDVAGSGSALATVAQLAYNYAKKNGIKLRTHRSNGKLTIWRAA